jgi:SMC interacting uncharacterized protein involved in chromosome segregation
MLTEQEAVAQLNDKISKNQIKATTKRYLDKIKALQNNIEQYNEELRKIEEQKRTLDKEIERTKGGISILLELAAEDEGMLEILANSPINK